MGGPPNNVLDRTGPAQAMEPRRSARMLGGRGAGMMHVSDELKTRYPALDATSVEELLGRAAAAQVRVSRADAVSPIAKIPLKVRDLLQIALDRNIELTKGFVSVCNQELLVPAFVLGRAIVETGALAWDAYKRADRILAARAKNDLPELDRHLVNVLLGAKSKEALTDPVQYPAPNVLTIIDRITKSDVGNLRGLYDLLCEFAHPNHAGMQAVYRDLDPVKWESRARERPFADAIHAVEVAFQAVAVGFEMSVAAVELYEDKLTALAGLCEEHIWEGGTWPPSLPYPVQR